MSRKLIVVMKLSYLPSLLNVLKSSWNFDAFSPSLELVVSLAIGDMHGKQDTSAQQRLRQPCGLFTLLCTQTDLVSIHKRGTGTELPPDSVRLYLQAVNENSLKRLNGYLENLQKGGSVQPLQVTFYVREDRPACPTNVPLTRPSHGTPRASKARAFQAVSFTLLSQEPLAAVRNILHSCQLPTEHLSSLRPSTSPWSLSHDPQISRPDRPIIWDPSYYVFTGRASPRRKAQSSQVDLSLRSWLRKRAEDAHAKLEGSLPLREQLHHLTKDLCLELKLTDIRWQRQWGLAYRNSHLHSLARLVEQYPEPVQCLRGKTVLFTDHSGVNAHGDAMLGIMDVHHHWIKVMEERGCCKLALTQLQQAEGRLALQLGGLQLTVLEPDCHVVPLGEHFRRIQVLQRRVLSGRLLFHPGSLQNLLMILGGADSKLQLLDEGVFEVPALCQVTSLQQFLLKNAGKAQRRLLEQHSSRCWYRYFP
uniref:T cell activation inhibitor, mitochondrial n=1 Tax=Eptatretus burgeri TaxID=7764 RepID=A0A8C4QTR4_EPTBU